MGGRYVNSDLPNSWDNKISPYSVRMHNNSQTKIILIMMPITNN